MYARRCMRSGIYTANVLLFSECGKFFMLNVVNINVNSFNNFSISVNNFNTFFLYRIEKDVPGAILASAQFKIVWLLKN